MPKFQFFTNPPIHIIPFISQTSSYHLMRAIYIKIFKRNKAKTGATTTILAAKKPPNIDG